MTDLSTIDHQLLNAAIAQAEKSASEGGIPIGAALGTPDGTVVALGHNLRVQTGDSTAHAEVVCFRNAGRRRDWHELTLATTLSPCIMCTGASLLHRVPRIIIGENQTLLGGEQLLLDSGVRLFYADNDRCKDLMRTFISRHPDLWNEDIGVPPGKNGS